MKFLIMVKDQEEKSSEKKELLKVNGGLKSILIQYQNCVTKKKSCMQMQIHEETTSHIVHSNAIRIMSKNTKRRKMNRKARDQESVIDAFLSNEIWWYCISRLNQKLMWHALLREIQLNFTPDANFNIYFWFPHWLKMNILHLNFPHKIQNPCLDVFVRIGWYYPHPSSPDISSESIEKNYLLSFWQSSLDGFCASFILNSKHNCSWELLPLCIVNICTWWFVKYIIAFFSFSLWIWDFILRDNNEYSEFCW